MRYTVDLESRRSAALEAMARDTGPVTLRRLRQELSAVASVDLLVRRLIERGLVYRTGPL